MSSDMRPTQCVRPALERPLPRRLGAMRSFENHQTTLYHCDARAESVWHSFISGDTKRARAYPCVARPRASRERA